MERFKIKSSLQIYFLSFITGLLSGLVVILFSFVMAEIEHFIGFNNFDSRYLFRSEFTITDVLKYLLIPTIGGLAVGIITSNYCKEAAGNGMDNLMEAFHFKEGFMKGRISIFKTITTLLTLGSGGSAGKEGPVAQIGASIGSKICTLFKGGARARRTLLLAGSASALGTAFQAPLGGALTSIEMVYEEDIESDALMPAIISSISAYILYHLIGYKSEWFGLGGITSQAISTYPFYILLGAICFGIGYTFIRFNTFVKSTFSKLNIKPFLKPALGGFLVGSVGLFFPAVIGTGESFIRNFSTGSILTYDAPVQMAFMIVLLILVKGVVTSLTIASGGSGGIFGPSLFLGGSIGALVAFIAKAFFQVEDISVVSFMLVGMGAFYSGVARAPIAGMVMICELVGNYVLLPPLMFCAIIILITSGKVKIYQFQTKNRFHTPAHLWDIRYDVLRSIFIKNYPASIKFDMILTCDTKANKATFVFGTQENYQYIVMDENWKYLGVYHPHISSKISSDFSMNDFKEEEVKYLPSIDYEKSIGDAMEIIVNNSTDKVPVIKEGNLIGYLQIDEIMKIYYQVVKNK